MKLELLQKIDDLFDADADLSGAMNALEFNEVPEGTELPYCVCWWISGTPYYTAGSGYQEAVIRFAIWEKKLRTALLAGHAAKLLVVYGDEETTPTYDSANYHFQFRLAQTRSFAEEDAWQWQADYSVVVTAAT